MGIPWERGVAKATVFKGKYGVKLRFPEGWGGCKPKDTVGGEGGNGYFLEPCIVDKDTMFSLANLQMIF